MHQEGLVYLMFLFLFFVCQKWDSLSLGNLKISWNFVHYNCESQENKWHILIWSFSGSLKYLISNCILWVKRSFKFLILLLGTTENGVKSFALSLRLCSCRYAIMTWYVIFNNCVFLPVACQQLGHGVPIPNRSEWSCNC